jgi:hypothetical protein
MNVETRGSYFYIDAYVADLLRGITYGRLFRVHFENTSADLKVTTNAL